jgi:hypothetical protein
MTMTIGAVASSKAAAAGGAVRFSSSAMKYTRTATGLASNFTYTFWVKIAVDRNASTPFIGQDNSGANYYFISTPPDGTTLRRDVTSGGSISSGVSMTVGTWYYAATVNDTGAGVDIFGWKVAGGSWTTANPAAGLTVVGPADANTFYIAGDGFGGFLNGSIAAVKIWTAVLTDAELQAEAATYAPVRTSGLFANYQFRNGPQTTDDSGNGRTLTQGGTPVLDAAGPPIT